MPMPSNPFGAPATSPTGQDIEDALSMIESNGGSGTWEEAAEQVGTPRWLFPRFPEATTIGTCDNKTKVHVGIHNQTDKCKDFEPDSANMYLSRAGIGEHDSDVETIVAWMGAPRNIVGGVCLLGDPGTGKTALIEAAATHAERTLTTVVCTPDHNKDSLFLRFMGEGRGEDGTPYALGPIPYAAKHGHWLYCDEVLLLMDGVKPLLYPLADGRHILPEGNVDGSGLDVHPDFRLIVSSNPTVRGASLPEPLGSRFASTTLTVETSAAMLRDLAIDDALVSAWEALKQQGLWYPAVRELRMADYWLDVDLTQATSAFIPEHCPESQRKQVRDLVVSFIGGDLRDDGRLVVS